MKRVYWRPKAVSRTALMLIAAFSILGLLIVESLPILSEQPYQDEKKAAAKLAEEAFETIWYEREATGVEVDLIEDPTGSGLLGLQSSTVTSLAATLEAKQSSINPNFAAVAVQMFKEIGIEKGDVVAVGLSGSFPALNIAAYAALETLEAEPLVIASVASSAYGANIPELLWIDMERHLEQAGVFKTRAFAASIGGTADRGLRFPKDGLEAIQAGIERNNLELINIKKFEENVDERMKMYRQRAGDRPIKAYVNVGGGMISIGRTVGKRLLKSGVNYKRPTKREGPTLDGVMFRFLDEGVPGVHLVEVEDMCEKYGLPISPQSPQRVGDAGVFERKDYNKWLTAGVLITELFLLYAFIRSDIGFRIFRKSGTRKSNAAPEPMV